MSSVAERAPTLSQLEWRAVSDALTDAARCGCGIRQFASNQSLFRALTGGEAPRPTADPKLKAVRSFVCETNRHRRIAKHRVAALLDHGFNNRQVDALALLSA